MCTLLYKRVPVDSLVISVTQIHSGDAYNVIPDSVTMKGSVRTFQTETRKEIPSSMLRVAEGVCQAFGANCELNYMLGYPATVNSVPETDISAKAIVTGLKVWGPHGREVM